MKTKGVFPKRDKKVRLIRPMSLVKLKEGWEEEYEDIFKKGSKRDNTFLYIGEITNMLGHGVFIGQSTQQIYTGLHIHSFVELDDEEL